MESDRSAGKAPGSTDVACIGAGKRVVMGTATNVGVTEGEGELVIEGTLDVVGALEVSIRSIVLESGRLLADARVEELTLLQVNVTVF